MRTTSVAIGAILALGLTATREARAQYWLQDRTLTEGRGIRAGSFEIHPGAGVEVGYDANVYARPTSEPTPGAIRLRLTPSISISTLGPQRTGATGAAAGGANQSQSALPTANFRANAGLTYHHFFGIGEDMSALSGLGASLGFRLELFPGRTWQFNLADDFSRIVQGGPEGGLALAIYNRNVNRAQAEIVFAPAGGIIDLRLGYANTVTLFDSPQVRYYSSMTHEISLRNRWRFLPKTAFMWEASFLPTVYLNRAGTPTGLFESYPLRTRFGLNGLFTERFGMLVMVGYHGTFFTGGDNADTVVAQLEARWITGPTSAVRVGAQRDVQQSFVGNYYVRNRLYVNYSQSFNGRFLFSGDVSGGLHENGYISDPSGANAAGTLYSGGGVDPMTGRFLQWRIQAQVFAEYRFNDWFGVNLTSVFTANLTDVAVRTGTLGSMQSMQWTKFEVYLGARVNW